MKSVTGHALALSALMVVYPSLRLDGHAILLSSAPAINELVNGKSVQIVLRFSSRIDGKRSKLTLHLPGGGDRMLTGDQPSPDTIRSVVEKLVPGSYILRWQILAEDGHITRGELPFRTQ